MNPTGDSGLQLQLGGVGDILNIKDVSSTFKRLTIHKGFEVSLTARSGVSWLIYAGIGSAMLLCTRVSESNERQ